MIGLPTMNPVVLTTVMMLLTPFVEVAIVAIASVFTCMTGGWAYPRINPATFISIPGGRCPSSTWMTTSLVGTGFEYSIGNWVQVLSKIFATTPGGVVNAGEADPDNEMMNVLSRMLLRLSIALTTNVYDVSDVTSAGVPCSNPEPVIVSPDGKDPLSSAYVNDVAGSTGVADSWYAIGTVEG